jgi:hypothetical protein
MAAKWVAVFALIGCLSAPVFAQQPLEQRERLKELLRTVDAAKAEAVRLANNKKQQCITAVAAEQLCECLAQNLPLPVDFPQYATLVAQTKEELKYDKLAPLDKKVVDRVREVRDQCVAWELHVREQP